MKIGNNLILGLIVVILGCGLYLLDEHLEHRQKVRVKVKRVFDITTEPITAAAFETPDQRTAFIRKGESWFLQEPVRARANGPQVERIVSALEALQRQDTITQEQREQRGLGLEDYGLRTASHHLSIETANGRAESLHLGGETPFGNTLYARLDRSDVVFTLPESVLDLFPQDLAALRDRTLLYGNPASTERIDIHRRGAGFLQLTRQQSGWEIQQPLAAKADSAAVRNLLNALFALRVQTFHWDAEPDSAGGEDDATQQEMTRLGQFEAAGLADDAARFRITIWTEGDRLGQDLLIGAPVADADNQCFARRGGINAIYTIPADITDICSHPVNHFRSRHVFHQTTDDIGFIRLRHNDNLLELERLEIPNEQSRWRLLAPLHAAADPQAVQLLISRLRELKISRFINADRQTSHTPPCESAMRITLAKAAPDHDKPAAVESRTLFINAPTNGLRTAFMATREDDPFILDATDSSELNPSLISPLHFRNPLMLSVDASAVSRITLNSPQITCTVSRAPDSPDRWTCPDKPDRAVDTTAVENLLATAASIEAADFVAFMPADRSRFGLNTPNATVTFGYRSDGGLQNSILVGAAADDAWHYAMILGHEFVFLLPESIVKTMLQPLCIIPPPPSPPPSAQSATNLPAAAPAATNPPNASTTPDRTNP